MTVTAASAAATPVWRGGGTRYVRIRDERDDGFIVFDFAIGDPGLSCELILPAPAFAEFCRANHAVTLTVEQAVALDADNAKWRYGQPGVTE